MLKFLKTTVAEDAITTEEVLVVVLAEAVLVAIEVQLQEEKVTLLQEERVLVALEATEVLLLEKALLDLEVVLHQELEVSLMPQDVKVVLQKDQQDVLKVQVMLQEKEDLEEAKSYSLAPLTKGEGIMELKINSFVNFLIIIFKDYKIFNPDLLLLKF
jgi:hypothetical protein